MKILENYNKEEINLLQNVGIDKERDYSKEEIEIKIGNFIMSQSTKNEDMGKIIKEYSNILEKLI